MIGVKKYLRQFKFSSFKEIWLSKKSCTARKRLNNSDREFDPCNVCDVTGTLIGKKHANAWNEEKQ